MQHQQTIKPYATDHLLQLCICGLLHQVCIYLHSIISNSCYAEHHVVRDVRLLQLTHQGLSVQQLPVLVFSDMWRWLLVLCRHPQYVVYASIVVSVLHVLSFLFTHWIVSFNALVNYKRVGKLNDAEYIQVGLAGCQHTVRTRSWGDARVGHVGHVWDRSSKWQQTFQELVHGVGSMCTAQLVAGAVWSEQVEYCLGCLSSS
jgi:hypothetical protein